MKVRAVIIILLLPVLIVACRSSRPDTRGVITLSSRILPSGQAYYAMGFSFATASKMRTDAKVFPDIVLRDETDASGDITNVFFEGAPGFSYMPFSYHGSYADEDAASEAFLALRKPEALSYVWQQMAKPLMGNQIWLFRTSDEKYAKLRIIRIEKFRGDIAPWAECTFEWVFQPDGSFSFAH